MDSNAQQQQTTVQIDDEVTASVLLMSQNIGTFDASGKSISDEVKKMTDDWIAGLANFIEGTKSLKDGSSSLDIFVLNLQEIGGKKYSDAFNDYLSKRIHLCYPSAGWCSGLLMHRKEDNDTFTAMGTVIFVSSRFVSSTSLLSVRHRVYLALQDKPETQVSSLEHLFHGAKFSNAEKSRKGYLLTSLRVGPRIMNFMNLHLYHDADNATAVEESPSVYVPRRREALLEAMVEVAPLINPTDSLFLFGDFNFRLDGHHLYNFLTSKFGKLEMGKKEVKAPEAAFDWMNNAEGYLDEMKQFDQEGVLAMEAISQTTGVELAEFARLFRPTYAYVGPEAGSKKGSSGSAEGGEDPAGETEVVQKKEGPRKHATARLPAWCDRVLFNPAALAAMSNMTPFKTAPSLPKGKARENYKSSLSGENTTSYTYASAEITEMDHQAVYLLSDVRIM